jgi:hypothetical protein
MKIVFHGTSIQNAKKILQEGFKPRKKNWKVSEKLAYFYDCSSYIEGLSQAITQGSVAAFKHVTECRRAVIAVKLDKNLLSVDATNTGGPNTYQYNGCSLTPDSIVGFWHDIYNLRDVRPIFLFNSQHLIHKVNKPNLIKDFEPLFPRPQKEVSVPIKQVFCNFDLGFDVSSSKFIL